MTGRIGDIVNFSKVLKNIKKHSRGAISIMLLVCMCPFLTVAAILIELNRFNNAVVALDELMGVSSTATLGHFDKYLHQRFGLLSVSQERDIDAVYDHYFGFNSTLFGKTIDVDFVDVRGALPLSDAEVLKRQIMEYTYLDAPTTFARDEIPVDELAKMLYDNIDGIRDIIHAIDGAGGAMDGAVALLGYAKQFRDMTDMLDSLKTQYSSSFSELDGAVSSLADAFSAADGADEEDEDAVKEAKEQLSSCLTSFNSAKQNYKSVVDNIKNTMEDYQALLRLYDVSLGAVAGNVTAAAADVGKLSDNINEAKTLEYTLRNNMEADVKAGGDAIRQDPVYLADVDRLAGLRRMIAGMETEMGVVAAGNRLAEHTLNGARIAFNAYTAARLQPYVDGFKTLSKDVSALSINYTNYDDYFTGIEYDPYYLAQVDGYIPLSALDAFLESQKGTFVDSSFSAVAKGFAGFYKALFTHAVFNDPELSAFIDAGFYNTIAGGLPGGPNAGGWVFRITRRAGEIMAASENLANTYWNDDAAWWTGVTAAPNPFQRILDIIGAILALLDNMSRLAEEMADIATGIAGDLDAFNTGHEQWWLGAYASYNMPCRTDNGAGGPVFTAMTGGAYSGSAFLAQRGARRSYAVSNMGALIGGIKTAAGGGADLTFCGAEMEYVLYGGKDEIANQAYAFLAMYCLRMIIDAPFVVHNAEVQYTASACTVGYPVAIMMQLFLEPFADMLALVNGRDAPLFKSAIYLTPDRLPELINAMDRTGFAACRADIKNAVASAFSATPGGYDYGFAELHGGGRPAGVAPELFDMDYRRHGLLLLIILPTESEQLARIQNIIQMEGYYHYRNDPGMRPFDLRRAYAGVYGEVSANVVQFLNIPKLSASDPFAVTRVQMRGY